MLDHMELVKVATIARIEQDAALVAIWKDNIYDNLKADQEPPYGRVGAMSAIPFTGDCIKGSDISFIVHGYSRENDREQANAIAAALVDLFTDDDGEMITLDVGSGVRGDFTVESWTVDEGTGVQGEWEARIFLNVTTSQ